MATIPESRQRHRPGITLAASLVLWWPSMRALLTGDLGVETAAIHFLAGAAVAWVGVTILMSLYTGYADGADLHAPPRAADPEETRPVRRQSDPE